MWGDLNIDVREGQATIQWFIFSPAPFRTICVRLFISLLFFYSDFTFYFSLSVFEINKVLMFSDPSSVWNLPKQSHYLLSLSLYVCKNQKSIVKKRKKEEEQAEQSQQ